MGGGVGGRTWAIEPRSAIVAMPASKGAEVQVPGPLPPQMPLQRSDNRLRD